MWFSFWRSRNRFSLEELRYLTDQLQKVQIVNEVNKDFVVEALRSIAELMTYGDQHDSAFFEFFMEKQVMGEFVRILKISRSFTVSLQLLQTMSIMIQNIKNEHAIYYLFSNEHINYLITYSFDFRNEELLSYYVSFLRAISGKLNKSTISLLVKTQNEEVVSFPLYVEAVRFAFHEESMIRIAIRALTLNIYHVRDEGVNRYVASGSLADYFSDLVIFFKKQCINLNELVFQASKEASEELSSRITAAVDEIEDNLYYFSDVISAGIPNVERLVMDNLLRVLILPLLLSSLIIGAETQIGAITSLFLLCCILRLVKLKDLANTVAAALFYPREAFLPDSEAKLNGDVACSPIVYALSGDSSNSHDEANTMKVAIPEAPIMQDGCSGEYFCLREILLSYLTKGDDVQVLGSLSVLATLLQTKELDESMLDALGILPQRKQHKKLLLEALVGESSGEEQLFSSENNSRRDSSAGELDSYLQKLKEQYGVSYSSSYLRSSPHLYRFKVLDALVNLICRTDVSAEAMWDGGWLLRQLLPYSEAEFNRQHLERLRESYKRCSTNLHHEVRGIWADLLITVLCDEWRKCKRAIESPSPRKELKYLLLPSQNQKSYHGDTIPSESSVLTGERVCELVKVFVLLYQFQIFCQGRALPDQPPLLPPTDVRENSRAKAVGLENVCPKPGTEIKLVDAVPCRIAFERGKERHLWFLAVSKATSGWLLLVEELPLRQNAGVVRVVAPLVASNPRIDDKHPRWLHVQIRPTLLPSADPPRRTKALVDGRWTLAFREEASCRSALSMVLDEINQQTLEIERRLKPLFDFSHVEVSSSLKPSIFS